MPPLQYNPLGPAQAVGQGVPEFNSRAAFQNLASTAGAYRKSAGMRSMDAGSRFPALVSGQETSERLLDRDVSDQLLQAQSGLQIQGMQEGLKDRRQQEANRFQEFLMALQQEYGLKNMAQADVYREKDRNVQKQGQVLGFAGQAMGSFI